MHLPRPVAPATLHVNTDNGIVTRVCVTTVIANNALICPPPGVTPMSFCFRQPLRRLPAVTSPHPDDRASLPGRSPLYLLNTEGVGRLPADPPPLGILLVLYMQTSLSRMRQWRARSQRDRVVKLNEMRQVCRRVCPHTVLPHLLAPFPPFPRLSPHLLERTKLCNYICYLP